MARPGRFLACSTITFRLDPVETALRRILEAGYRAVEIGIERDKCPHFDPVETTDGLIADFGARVRATGLLAPALCTTPPFEFAPVAQGKMAIQYAIESLKVATALEASVVV